MNNPALPMYAPQNQGQYAFNSPQAGGSFPMPSAVPFDTAQTPFQPGIIPYNQQRPSHPPQHQQHIPQPPYQQYPGQPGPYQQPDLHPHYNPQDRGESNHACPNTCAASGFAPECCVVAEHSMLTGQQVIHQVDLRPFQSLKAQINPSPLPIPRDRHRLLKRNRSPLLRAT